MMKFETVIEIGCHYQNTVLDMPQCRGAEIYLIDAVEEFINLIPNQDNVHKICAAITPEYTGKKKMRGILLSAQKNHNLPDWSTTMCSLHDEHHPTIKRFNWDEYTSYFEVNCYSVADFWDTFKLPKNFDFISTDLEGLDYSVVKALLDKGITSQVLRFESKLMSKDQLNEIKELLIKAGFSNIAAGSKFDFAGTAFNHWAYKGIRPNIDFT